MPCLGSRHLTEPRAATHVLGCAQACTDGAVDEAPPALAEIVQAEVNATAIFLKVPVILVEPARPVVGPRPKAIGIKGPSVVLYVVPHGRREEVAQSLLRRRLAPLVDSLRVRPEHHELRMIFVGCIRCDKQQRMIRPRSGQCALRCGESPDSRTQHLRVARFRCRGCAR